MAELTQRTASLGDLKDIWGLMRQVAADVPFDVASEAEQESLLSELMACCTSGLSPVAVDEGEAVVGAVLVRRDDFEWGFRNSNLLRVSCAAIASDHKGQGLLRELIAGVQGRKVPLVAGVRSGNQLGLADELRSLGFAHEGTAAGGWGELYRWQPVRGNGAART
jgi:hypothetical protein